MLITSTPSFTSDESFEAFRVKDSFDRLSEIVFNISIGEISFNKSELDSGKTAQETSPSAKLQHLRFETGITLNDDEMIKFSFVLAKYFHTQCYIQTEFHNIATRRIMRREV